MPMIALLFALTAFLYATVGFGGGSTYNAILIETAADYRMVPVVALVCNLAVTGLATIRAGLQQRAHALRALPILATSMPAAFLGGMTPISELHFKLVLGGLLCLSALKLGAEVLFDRRLAYEGETRQRLKGLAPRSASVR